MSLTVSREIGEAALMRIKLNALFRGEKSASRARGLDELTVYVIGADQRQQLQSMPSPGHYIDADISRRPHPSDVPIGWCAPIPSASISTSSIAHRRNRIQSRNRLAIRRKQIPCDRWYAAPHR